MLLRLTKEPGAQWVHVRRRTLRTVMGVERVWISKESRINGETVYLKAHDDFDLFRKAAESKGIPLRVTTITLNRRSVIHKYEPFDPDIV